MKNILRAKANRVSGVFFFGRNVKDFLSRDKIALFWSGSGFEVKFRGTELWAQFESRYESSEHFVCVFLNGKIIQRVMIPRGKKWICLVRGLSSAEENSVKVLRDSHPVDCDKNHGLFLCELGFGAETEFFDVPKKKFRIEFVGDSLTTGEGLYGNFRETIWIPSFVSFCKSYAMKTAQKLDADFRVVAHGGWGVLCGWNNNPRMTIPSCYEEVCSVTKGLANRKAGGLEKYDFLWKADFVVVNLGTNDSGAFFQPAWQTDSGDEYKLSLENDAVSVNDGERISLAVKEFLFVLRKKNPRAKIVWALGMMSVPLVEPLILRGIDYYKKSSSDKNVFFLKFDSMDEIEKSEEDKGSRMHPGEKTHECAAKKLSEFLLSIK